MAGGPENRGGGWPENSPGGAGGPENRGGGGTVQLFGGGVSGDRGAPPSFMSDF